MTINENLTKFAGKPVEDWTPDITTIDPSKVHYRIRLEYEDITNHTLWADRLAAYLDVPGSDKTTGIVIGVWGQTWEAGGDSADDVVRALVSARDKLSNLKAIFMGDIVMEESEISWIEQGDISPLFNAYADLEILGVRGGNHLRLGKIQHSKLKQLIIETGGMSREIAQDAIMADLPELEHLELWLGEENYGATTTPEDFTPLLNGERFPKLTYLGLRDSEIADDLAGVLANAPLIKRLDVLDLSLGNLSDVGANALLKSSLIPGLKKLDIHHHYCSDAVMEQLKKLSIEVDMNDRETPDQWGDEEHRFIAVGE